MQADAASKAYALGDKELTFVILDGKAAAMTKVQEWRPHAYELALKLCRDYGTQGKIAFKVGSSQRPSAVYWRILIHLPALV